MARIVNLKHEPDAVARGAVRIDRRTRWGNPFVVGRDGVIYRKLIGPTEWDRPEYIAFFRRLLGEEA